MNPLGLAGLATGIIGAIGGFFGNKKANKQLDAIAKTDPVYTENPLAKQRLALAQTILNSRFPGAATEERNIYGTQATQLGNIQRNATNSAQALALAGGVQGQTNAAFSNLGQEEAQNYYRNLQNLNSAEEGAINEGDKVFQDEQRRFGDRIQIGGAKNANRQNTWQSISNLGFGLGDLGMNGGFSGFFGQRKPTQSPSYF